MGDLIIGLGRAYMTCDQLFGLDESFNVRPQMAAGHELSDDGLLWRSTLRDGLVFHEDGLVFHEARRCAQSTTTPRSTAG